MHLTIECPQGHKTGSKVNVLHVEVAAILPLPQFVVGEHVHLQPIVLSCPAGEQYRFGPADGITITMEAI